MYSLEKILFKSIISFFLLIPSYGFCQIEIQGMASTHTYSWNMHTNQKSTYISESIPPPNNFKRLHSNKMYEWFRNLPLKPKGSKVLLYNLEEKNRQDLHEAVLRIDIGKRDLQQCADAVIRLRAEYLYSLGEYDKIHFDFTNGQNIPYAKWRDGYRIQFKNNKAHWVISNQDQTSYASFRKYLDLVFAYAGTYSLSRELSLIDIDEIAIGDVFIEGGFPGHAVLVVDIAQNGQGEKCILLAQSYMPAQSIHILKNLNDPGLSPWYSVKSLINKQKLYTPEWTFPINSLRRFEL